MAESTRSSLLTKAVNQCHSVTAFGDMSEMALSARSGHSVSFEAIVASDSQWPLRRDQAQSI